MITLKGVHWIIWIACITIILSFCHMFTNVSTPSFFWIPKLRLWSSLWWRVILKELRYLFSRTSIRFDISFSYLAISLAQTDLEHSVELSSPIKVFSSLRAFACDEWFKHHLRTLASELAKDFMPPEKNRLSKLEKTLNDTQMLNTIPYICYWYFCFSCIKRAKFYLIC